MATATLTRCCSCFRTLDSKDSPVFHSKLRPRQMGKCPFHFHDLDTLFLAFCIADLGLRSKTQSFYMFVVTDGFQASLSYKRSNFGLVDDILQVAYGNYTESQTTFWRALPSWFCIVPNDDLEIRTKDFIPR